MAATDRDVVLSNSIFEDGQLDSIYLSAHNMNKKLLTS